MQAVLVEMVRQGIVPVDVIEAVGQKFDTEARYYEGNSRQARYESLSSIALEVQLQAAAPSATDFRAEQRRKQIRVVPTDGGNEP